MEVIEHKKGSTLRISFKMIDPLIFWVSSVQIISFGGGALETVQFLSPASTK